MRLSPIPTPWYSPRSMGKASPPRGWCFARKSSRDAGYIVFYTNYQSHKGRDLEGQSARRRGLSLGPSAPPGARGGACRARARQRQNDAYFQSRPWQSRLGAWASRQSEPVESRGALGANVAAAARRFGIPYGGPGTPEPETVRGPSAAPAPLGGIPPERRCRWSCGWRVNFAFTSARAGPASPAAPPERRCGPCTRLQP